MKLKVKGILIDLDGTLVDSREAYCETFRITCKALGIDYFDAKKAFEIPKRLEQKLSIKDLIPTKDVRKFLNIYLKTYHKLTESKTKPLPGLFETLEKLEKKAKLALITMRYVPRERVKIELEKFGLAKYFHCITTALDTSLPKPFPEPVIKCANQLDVEVAECAVVGDSIIDVRAGKMAGAKTVAFLSGIFTEEELEKEKPDLILENINMLPDFLW